MISVGPRILMMMNLNPRPQTKSFEYLPLMARASCCWNGVYPFWAECHILLILILHGHQACRTRNITARQMLVCHLHWLIDVVCIFTALHLDVVRVNLHLFQKGNVCLPVFHSIHFVQCVMVALHHAKQLEIVKERLRVQTKHEPI